ncbi:MAG: 5'-3' exonuclease, partial [Thermoguttaceae bacterium]
MTHALDLTGKTVYVIDSHGLIFQLFYALPPMTSPQGEPVNAVYGFAKDLLTLLTRHRPDYLFCAFDHSSPTFRHVSDSQYKANRAAMPDDLRPQLALVREVVDAFGVASLVAPGFEADDILATVAAETESRGGHCCLVTSDKDARQLITEKTSLYMLRKQQPYTAAELLADWGITPEQVVDFQAMCGDASDNVRGISGVGPKTATQLLQQFGSLNAIFENVDKLTGKRREMFIAGRGDAEHARELVQLRRDVPLEINWDTAAAAAELDPERLQKTFLRFGFRTLIASIQNAVSTPTPAVRHSRTLQIFDAPPNTGGVGYAEP